MCSSDLYYTAYDPARNKALNVSPQSPLVLGAGNSLVKTISNTDTTLVPRLRTAAVLTCLSAAPRFGSFRPPYAGTDHTVRFALDQVDWTRLLSLAPATGAPSLANEIPKFQRMWLDQAPLWAGRMMHPLENMPDYGRDLAARYAQGALLCHTNLTLAQKQPLAISLIQMIANGAPLAEDFAESRLNYKMGRWHLGLVLWVDDPAQVEALRAKVPLVDAQVGLARDNLQIVQGLYGQGSASILDLFDAQSAFRSARTQGATLRVDLATAEYDLRWLLGEDLASGASR